MSEMSHQTALLAGMKQEEGLILNKDYAIFIFKSGWLGPTCSLQSPANQNWQNEIHDYEEYAGNRIP